MFYSHEVLTSRKYGVATVWLVATLGSRSGLKKINRKAIQDVDILKACSTIRASDTPMALRLQSSLLYGVSRVFSQQCSYMLVDALAAQAHLRGLLKVVKTSELDEEAGKARPDQLVLQDDPAFIPDLFLPSLDVYLAGLNSSTQGSSQRSIMSEHFRPSSRSSSRVIDQSLLGLIVTTPDSSNAIDIGDFDQSNSDPSLSNRQLFPTSFVQDNDGFNPDINFVFDVEGNIVELGAMHPSGQAETETAQTRARSSSVLSAQVRQELEEGMLAGQRSCDTTMGFAQGLPGFESNDYENAFATAEALPNNPTSVRSLSAACQEEESDESLDAAQTRKPRMRRELPVDAAQELRNGDLASWSSNYITNMAEKAHHKLQNRQVSQAKKNASAWVFGFGIGGVGNGLGSLKVPSPLYMFAGDDLMETLLTIPTKNRGRKRSRDEDEVRLDSEERRTRPRSDDQTQIGRGDDAVTNDNRDISALSDNNIIELGRDAVQWLEDHSTTMPWNVGSIDPSHHDFRQGSISGSVAQVGGYESSVAGFPTSIGYQSSLLPIHNSFDRRASRLVSASPIMGRGLSYRSHSIDTFTEHLGERLLSDDPVFDDFQLFGPAAAVDTQTAAQSQWVKDALDQESRNFFEFVKAELATRDRPSVENNIAFEELLPPMKHTRVVAAQAFLHVLALGSKGLLRVEQATAFGKIMVGLEADS